MTTEKIITLFYKLWKQRKFNEMLKLTQKSWSSTINESPLEWLKRVLGQKHIIEYKIEEIIKYAPASIIALIDVKEYYNNRNKDLSKSTYKIVLICEDNEGRATPEGNWGINPHSVLNRVKVQ